MAEILRGAPVAVALTQSLKTRADELKAKGIVPTLATIRISDRQDDVLYERSAIKRCEGIGIAVKRYILSEDITQDELLSVIDEINDDNSIHGALLFRPLPGHIDQGLICNALSPEKDIDGMTDQSAAGIIIGKAVGYPPCTAQACIEMLDHYGVDPSGKNVTVIGRSMVIGKPCAFLLLDRNATVTVCHSRTPDLAASCKNADIIVVAVGKAKTLTAAHVRPGQTVIDVGINVDAENKVCGDVDFNGVEPVVAAISPVPAGTGSITTAVLAKHVIEAAEKKVLT